MSWTKWTKEEIEYLKANYGKMDVREMAKALNGRTIDSICFKVHQLGLTGMKRKSWTEEEIAYIKANYGKMDAKEMAKALNGRTIDSIYQKARGIGLAGMNWTKEDDDFLRANYSKMNAKEIAVRLGRTENTVRVRANGMGLKRFREKWTEEEKEIVRENYGKMETSKIVAMLEGRTIRGVDGMAATMGIGFEKPKPVARPKVRKAEDYGPYDPTTHCSECAHYESSGRCKCWHVKGKDGGYKIVRAVSPACRYFLNGFTLLLR